VSVDLDELSVSYMSGSLPVLRHFAYTAWTDVRPENVVKRHGHKLYELRLHRLRGLGVFLCPFGAYYIFFAVGVVGIASAFMAFIIVPLWMKVERLTG
jgi:hypothetical protein